ncbi:MAG: hypothetical protein ACO1N9_12260 [Flavobacterium sp.]
MKSTLRTAFAFCAIVVASCHVSCSDDDAQTKNGNQQTGELALFAIDTAKVKVMTRIGTNETTIINKTVNLNSYINDMSISPDGTMIAYSNYQSSFSPSATYLRELRVANIDGSNDHSVYTNDDPGVNIGNIRFCSDNKIFFVVTTGFPNNSTTLRIVNADGTGAETIQGQYSLTDVTDDRRYYLVPSQTGNSVTIIDKNGDGGFGSLYYNVTFTQDQSIRSGVFTNDGATAVIPYTEGNSIKARIVNMAAKTHQDMTLITGLGSGWMSFQLEMAADNKHGVISVTGQDFARSKSYVFNLETGEVAQPFENNDENIFSVYIY